MNAKVLPHFSQIESTLCRYFSQADEVRVCVAWLSSQPILDVLSTVESQLVITWQRKLTPGSFEYDPALVKAMKQAVSEIYMYPADVTMHNKFAILLRDQLPYAVITGSYNYTIKAVDNCENIVYIESDDIATTYLKEFDRLRSVATRIAEP
jgi:phosphatidylserine/phosphatidylglycerophosphate/cardiolipin synthase-like enzyme